MKGWSRSTLGELCKNQNGKIQTGPFGSQLHQSDYVDDGIPVVMPKDINQQGIDLSSVAKISAETAERLSRHKLHKDEIVFPRRGEITKCALIKQEQEGFLCGTGCLKITVPAKALNPLFFRYYLAKKEIIEWLDGNAVGATMKNLSTGILQKLPVVYPALPIQKKIAGILSAYDDLIENNLKRIKLLEEMAQITYEEWFVRLRFPGHKTTPINPETGLPEGWRMGTMQDLFDFKNGYAFKSGTYVQDGQHKIVTIKNVQDGSFIPDTTDTIAELPSNIKAHHHLSTGDIIMSLTGNVGRVCLVYGENYLLNQRVAKVVPNIPADRLYVYTLLRSRGTLTQLENISNGAAQQNLSPVNASKMPALVPARNVLNDFNKNIGSIIDLICLKNIENNRLREARDILLPRLMTGVIDVESYDPAQLLKEAA